VKCELWNIQTIKTTGSSTYVIPIILWSISNDSHIWISNLDIMETFLLLEVVYSRVQREVNLARNYRLISINDNYIVLFQGEKRSV